MHRIQYVVDATFGRRGGARQPERADWTMAPPTKREGPIYLLHRAEACSPK